MLILSSFPFHSQCTHLKYSALHDHRFHPITVPEIPRLHCAVSLLTDFEPGTSYTDWIVGEHGIWIEFTDDNGRRRTATYLPEVMPEQGWTKLQAIDSLLRKGGFKGKISESVREKIKLTRYRSSKVGVTYEEYVEYRDAKVGLGPGKV